MTEGRYRRMRFLFESVVELPPDERAALLRRECGEDHELEADVTRLLACPPSLLKTGGAAFGMMPEGAFRGTGRFELQRILGAGGCGVVYEAFDRIEKTVVALKALPFANHLSITRFKQEFRILSDLVHPNLVALYELFAEEPSWYFTMERIDGCDFLTHVRGENGFCPERLRACLRQLVTGVQAIHDSGKLHCDLKPQNVLVEHGGRVVILDFGLSTEIRGALGGLAAGTPDYMSPEQAAGLPLTPATDWYSVGVMLHEALTGYLPSGRRREWAANVPTDLRDLCSKWLQSNPTDRITGACFLGIPAVSRTEMPLIGRETELKALETALDSAKGGHSSTVLISGASGAGKSALLNHFLLTHAEQGDCLVLSGRCYERESLPFKALDTIIDQLTTFLLSLTAEHLDQILPSGMDAVVRLFPVLRRVAARSPSYDPGPGIADSADLRRHAFRVLLELLRSVAAARPVLIAIDDLQWGDLDSAPLLMALVQEGQARRVLFIACYRSSGEAGSPLLNTVMAKLPSPALRITVGRLDTTATRRLAVTVLGESREAERVATLSAGYPYLLVELARYARSRSSEAAETLSIDDMVRARLSLLPQPARRLLEVVAIAAQPVDANVARAAASSTRAELVRLASARLILVRGEAHTEVIETYHDRIRETVTASLDHEALKNLHGRLAVEWETSGAADCRALAIHFYEAGILSKASRYAVEAGEQAAAALAFDSAASFYRLALEAGPTSRASVFEIRSRLGNALSAGGRGAEAGDAYLAAAELVTGRERIDLQRRAAAQYLIAGQVEETIGLIRQLLRAVGMKLPSTRLAAVAWYLYWTLLTHLRGVRYRVRPAKEVDAELLLRVDVCFSMVHGLSAVDTIRALPFQAYGVWLALRCGEPARLARALTMLAGSRALRSVRPDRRAERLLDDAEALAGVAGDALEAALVALSRGIAAFLRAEWQRANELLAAAEGQLRERCTAVAWDLAICRSIRAISLLQLGRLDQSSAIVLEILDDAEKRSDRLASADASVLIAPRLRLFQDQPELANQEVTDAMSRWESQAFGLQSWGAALARVEIALYRGNAATAWAEMEQCWRSARWMLLARVPYFSIQTLQHRARAAIALAGTQSRSSQRKLLRIVRQDIDRIERFGSPWGNALAILLRAGAGDPGTEALLAKADLALSEIDMTLHALAARRLRGTITGDWGLAASVDEVMKSCGVCNPARLSNLLAPSIEVF